MCSKAKGRKVGLSSQFQRFHSLVTSVTQNSLLLGDVVKAKYHGRKHVVGPSGEQEREEGRERKSRRDRLRKRKRKREKERKGGEGGRSFKSMLQ